MLASSWATLGPVKLTVAATSVGISYTWLASSAVTGYSRVTPPNVRPSVGAMICFAVGVIAYVRLVASDAIGDAVVCAYVAPVDVTACVAPTGATAPPKLHTSVACLLIVTTDPSSGPVLVTATVVDARLGNAYISDAATEAVTVVRVAANVNVSATGAPAGAVTVAPTTLVCANVAPSTTVVAVVAVSAAEAETADPAANGAITSASIAGFVLENVSFVAVAVASRSLYCVDPAIGATATAFGTAYTTCRVALELSLRLAPDGAVTSSSNTSCPVVAPSVIELTWTEWPLDEYVYELTAPATSAPPTNTLTAPVPATSATFVVSASHSSIEIATDVYVCPAANPSTS